MNIIRVNLTVFFSLLTILCFSQNDMNEIKSEFRDGTEWKYYIDNDVKISSTSIVERDYGKWYKINIIIFNNSNKSIEIDPEKHINAQSIDKDNKLTNLEVWNSEKYLKKVKRAQNWAIALSSAAEGLNVGTAGYSNTSSYSYNNGYTYSNNYNNSQAYQAKVISQMRLEDLSNKMFDERKTKQLGYLKKNTIHPGESIQGYVNIKYVPANKLYLAILIQNTNYKFNWDYSKK